MWFPLTGGKWHIVLSYEVFKNPMERKRKGISQITFLIMTIIIAIPVFFISPSISLGIFLSFIGLWLAFSVKKYGGVSKDGKIVTNSMKVLSLLLILAGLMIMIHDLIYLIR